MPLLPDKVEMNTWGIAGMSKAIAHAMKSASYLGYEVIELGGGTIHGNKLLAEDAKLFLAEQENLCAAIDKAMMEFYIGQNALNEKRRKWLDSQITP